MKRVIMIIVALMLLAGACAENYPATLIVKAVNREADTVTLRNSEGYEWTHTGAEDWQPGDLVSAIMDDCGTASIRDDIIVSLRYCSFDIKATESSIDGREC